MLWREEAGEGTPPHCPAASLYPRARPPYSRHLFRNDVIQRTHLSGRDGPTGPGRPRRSGERRGGLHGAGGGHREGSAERRSTVEEEGLQGRQTTLLNTVAHAPFPLGRGPTGVLRSRELRVTGWTRSLTCPHGLKGNKLQSSHQACGHRAPTALFRASRPAGCKSSLWSCLSSSGFSSNLPATLFDRKEGIDSSVDRHPDCVGNSACVCVCFP